MTPLISTRLAAASPRPESASIAGSRPLANSLGPSLSLTSLSLTSLSLISLSLTSLSAPSLLGPVPLDGGPPSFLDSNPSDPMTPDPTPNTRPSMPIHDAATRIFESKDNTPARDGCKKNKFVRSYKQPCAAANQFHSNSGSIPP